MKKSRLTLYDCDRCKFTYKKKDLRKQRGMLLCDPCYDSVLEIVPVNLKLLSPRVNSNTTTPVSVPIIFSITSLGIVALLQSQIFTRQGLTNSYVMYIVGDLFAGALKDDDGNYVRDDDGNYIFDDSDHSVSVTANPQIVPGTQGTLLTLVGTSDINYVIINPGNGTDLTTPMYLRNGNQLSLVYNAVSSLWCETSRS